MYYTSYYGKITRLETIVRTIPLTASVPATAVDEVALLGRGTDTSTAVTAHGGAAALGLALVVREDEEVIVVQRDRRTGQRLIRGIGLVSL